jgi:predicted Fe-S protein YdhL (DUF1289 family)
VDSSLRVLRLCVGCGELAEDTRCRACAATEAERRVVLAALRRREELQRVKRAAGRQREAELL